MTRVWAAFAVADRARLGVISLLLSSLVLAGGASGAHAAKIVDRVVAGGAPGSAEGQFSIPQGVAINDPGVADNTTDPSGGSTDGYIYVADENNRRVQVFGADESFAFAFGSAGSAEGQFNGPRSIAINQQTGDAYVTDGLNRRVQQFAADGTFIRTWGWGVGGGSGFEVCSSGCQAGVGGVDGGQFGAGFSISFQASPIGIAVDPNTPHHVFVGDPRNQRLQEFTADGSFVRLWGWDVVPTGQPGDRGDGDTNVEASSFEICSSTDPGRCKSGSFDREDSGTPDPRDGYFGAGGFGDSPQGDAPAMIAIDDTGTVYADMTSSWPNLVQRFNSDAVAADDVVLPHLTDRLDGLAQDGVVVDEFTGDLEALAVRPDTGNLLISRAGGSGLPNRTQELDTSVEPPVVADNHLLGSGLAVAGLAVDPGSDDFYLTSTTGGHRLFAADDDGSLPRPGLTVDPDPLVENGSDVTFSGTVDPNGPVGIPTTYNFQYREVGQAEWITVPGSDNPLGDGDSPVPVSDQVSGLQEGFVYEFRLTARKAFGNPDVATPPQEFSLGEIPPTAETLFPQARTDTSAVLTALINPNARPTSYRFEWGTDTGYGNTIPIPDGSAGSGVGIRMVVETIDGLQPGTTYHYRVVADNGVPVDSSCDPEVEECQTEVDGGDVSFTTRPASGAMAGRGYELVSPADKCGGQGVGFWPGGLGHIASSGLAAHLGERFAVLANYGATLDCGGGFSHSNDWTFAERADERRGWLSQSPLTHPNYHPLTGQPLDLRAAADDLSAVNWKAPGTLAFFPEIASWSARTNVGMISDWGGPLDGPTRWELFGPTSLDQAVPRDHIQSQLFISGAFQMTFSPDGSSVVGQANLAHSGSSAGLPQVHGLAGPDDPTWPEHGDLDAGRSLWLGDLSGGLADSFEGTGARELVNVCTGTAGVDRTMLPAVDGAVVGESECPAGNEGRQRLLSRLGATFAPEVYIRPGAVSQGGSRVFFLSPDPVAAGVPDGTGQFCTGSGEATVCPPQLFVRQRNADGSVVTRWLSKAEDGLLGEQASSLLGTARFEGASRDGKRVFFRTNSPLTADDRNGLADPPVDGVTEGTPDSESWDLYMLELADGADPTGPGSSLTRVSAGPNGDADCNSPLRASSSGDDDSVGALRYVSDDGSRAYFTCQAPISGADVSSGAAGATEPDGTPTTGDQTNLYLFDLNQPESDRWRFVARLPRATGDSLSTCATTGVQRRSPFLGNTTLEPDIGSNASGANCVQGTADGSFVTFFTEGRLTKDDLDDPAANPVADIYGYDATTDELQRLTVPQGGDGDPYKCIGDFRSSPGDESLLYSCRGDGGIDEANGVALDASAPVNLGLATDPTVAGDRVAFFQSASKLTADDRDDGYDVYQWRNGKLSLLTDGSAGSEDALYKGNDRSGRNVYFVTRQALTWQDHDVVADIYTARIGGGIVQPPPAPVCPVLPGGCHGGGAAPIPDVPSRTAPLVSGGNADPGARKRLALRRPGARARRRAARRGVLVVRVRSSEAGRVAVIVRGRVGKRVRRLGRASKRLSEPGATRVSVRLNRAARKRLRSGHPLRLTVQVRSADARPKSVRVTLRRAGG
jgi:hypothetical protein